MTVELHSFGKYLFACCVTGAKAAERAAAMISSGFSAAQQGLKEGSKVGHTGWEGIAENRSGYLVQGAAAVALASTGEGSDRQLTVSENVGLTLAAAASVTARLCRESS